MDALQTINHLPRVRSAVNTVTQRPFSEPHIKYSTALFRANIVYSGCKYTVHSYIFASSLNEIFPSDAELYATGDGEAEDNGRLVQAAHAQRTSPHYV